MNVTINEANSFLVTDDLGDVVGASELGLYHHDIRYLSRYELRLGGERLVRLASHVPQYFRAVHVLTNPFVGQTPEGAVAVERWQTLSDEGLHEDIEVHNYSDTPVSLPLEFLLAADFRHVFEVRSGLGVMGAPAAAAKASFTPLEGGLGVRIAARAGLPYVTELAFSRAAVIAPGGEHLRFSLDIPPREAWRLCVDMRTARSDEALRDASSVCGRFARRAQEEPGQEFAEQVLAEAPRLETDYLPLRLAYERSLRDLAALRLKGERVSAIEFTLAAGIPWFMALFGRDSLITAYQARFFIPRAARGVLRALARLQGTKVDPLTAEEPGKILHEYRPGLPEAERRFIPGSPYYGTIDATPFFIILLGETYRSTGDLDLVRELRPHLEAALQWMDCYGDRDGDGYIEYLRETPTGLANQGWKDSGDAIRFRDGHIADPPIALSEVQGYAYRARLLAADLFAALGEEPRAASLREGAATLQRRFNADFWLPERGYYALALDGSKRRVDSLTSNPGQSLWSGIVDPERHNQVVSHLLGAELFSGWGVRTMGSQEGGFSPIGYHTGTVWPHDNSLIADGLSRLGFRDQAGQIAAGMLAAAAYFPDRRLPELFAGFDRTTLGFPVSYPVACMPQAWSSGAILLLLAAMLGLQIDVPRRRIELRPWLLPVINELSLSGISIGGGTLDLEVRRTYGEVQTRLRRVPRGFKVEGTIYRWSIFW